MSYKCVDLRLPDPTSRPLNFLAQGNQQYVTTSPLPTFGLKQLRKQSVLHYIAGL